MKHNRADEIERIVPRREYKEDKEILDRMKGWGGTRLARELKTCQNSCRSKKDKVPARRVRIFPLHCRVLSTVVSLPVGARRRSRLV